MSYFEPSRRFLILFSRRLAGAASLLSSSRTRSASTTALLQYLIEAFAASFLSRTLHFLAWLAIATLTAVRGESRRRELQYNRCFVLISLAVSPSIRVFGLWVADCWGRTPEAIYPTGCGRKTREGMRTKRNESLLFGRRRHAQFRHCCQKSVLQLVTLWSICKESLTETGVFVR